MTRTSNSRRSFVHKLTAIAAGLGGVALGLVPEVRLRAATAPAPSPATPAGDPNQAPPSQPLSTTAQNALYSSALNDAGVAMLVRSLGAPGRLDPPQESCELSLSNGGRPQTVVLPVRSYTDSSALAFVFYGVDANPAASDNAAPTLTGIVTRAGKVQLAINGVTYDSPYAQWNDVYMAKYFPAEYLAADAGSASPAATTRTSQRGLAAPGRWLAAWRESGWRMQKTMQANGNNNPGYGPCVAGCMANAQACLAAAMAGGLAALGMALWCGVCIILAVGAAVTTGPIGTGVVLTKCAYACLWMVGAMAALALALAACQTVRRNCVANCGLQFPPLPPAGMGA